MMADRKTQKLLEGLQQDLTRELHAVLQYSYQAAMVLGPRSLNLRDYLRREAEGEMKHVGFLADQIVNLGGAPKFSSPKISEIKDLKQMLESDLDLERDAILEYRERAKQADLAGEPGLKIRLEELLAEESDHAHELERLLRGWQ
jgi:bacterioferritin